MRFQVIYREKGEIKVWDIICRSLDSLWPTLDLLQVYAEQVLEIKEFARRQAA